MNRRGASRRQGPSGETLDRRGGLRRKGLALVGAGALVLAVAAPAMAVGPGDLDPDVTPDGQEDGWDLVAFQECTDPGNTDVCFVIGGGPIFDEVSFARDVDNDSGWSYEAATGTGYAVLDPSQDQAVQLGNGDYDGVPDEVDDGVPLAAMGALEATIRTVDRGLPPRVVLRVAGTDVPAPCRLFFEFPTEVLGWTPFDLKTEPRWRSSGQCGAVNVDGVTWGDMLDAFPDGSAPALQGTFGAPGVSLESGDAGELDLYDILHVDSFMVNGVLAEFNAPTLNLEGTGPADPINAGESVDVELAATLSGPNQATIFNEVNFLTGAGGLDSGGTFGQTEGPEGLCTVEVEPVVTEDPATLFAPEQLLATRPLDLGLGDGRWSVVERETTVTVTVTASEDVLRGGTCVIGIVDPLNAEPIGTFTVQVNDTRPAPALPEDVPADAGALTVEPECVVEGDMMTVTAPAGSFAPDSLVNVGLYDSGIDLGEQRAGSDGSLDIEGPLPNGVLDGPQEVLAVGYASTENDVDLTYLSAEFEVGCADGGGSGGVPSGIPAGGGIDDGSGLLGNGLATILAIGGFLGLRRLIRG